MLRELLDAATLEDFLGGLALLAGARLAVYDAAGELVAQTPPVSRAARVLGITLERLPRPLDLRALPADAPPAEIGLVRDGPLWYVVAPIRADDRTAGYVALGEQRDPAASPPACPDGAVVSSDAEWLALWLALPALDRSAGSPAIATARWASRVLSYWLRREAQLDSAGAELALVGDIGSLLVGEHRVQTVLDRIVAETARVMKCPYASLRLYDPSTDELQIAAAYNLSADYRHIPRIRRSENPIDAEALQGRTIYIEDAQTDPRFQFREEARRMNLVSGLTTGMMHQGRPVGVLRIYSDRRQRFRAGQRHLLRAVASQAAISIVNARLLEERLRALALERQLALAGEVQKRLMRVAPPPMSTLRTAVVFEPSSHVGGDFCDLLTLPDGRLLAAIGDVAGHGLAAALLTASVRGALRGAVRNECDLPRILTLLNEHVFQETSSSEFVTLALAAVDARSRRLTCCSAGHEPLLLARRGRVEAIDDAGLVLGVDPHQNYASREFELLGGDFLLWCTDGVVEALNFQAEAFGRQRLRDALLAYSSLEPDQALRNIRWDVRRFVGLAEQTDDLTMLAMQVLEPAPPGIPPVGTSSV